MSTANYNLGLGILKTLYGHMKTTQSFDNFLKGLQLTWYGEVIPEAEFKSWVSGIQDKKALFLQIADDIQERFDHEVIKAEVSDQYFNMIEKVKEKFQFQLLISFLQFLQVAMIYPFEIFEIVTY